MQRYVVMHVRIEVAGNDFVSNRYGILLRILFTMVSSLT